MIAAIVAAFLVAGFVFEVTPAPQAAVEETDATRKFLSTFYLPGTADPIVGTPADFVVRDEHGTWRPAPVVRIQ